MITGMNDPIRPRPEPVPNLRDAVRRARLDDAERSAAVAELRTAERVRLEILRDALAPVMAELPEDASLFDNGLVPGEHPRLHVDILAYVEMGPDRRHYRFVQDTRWGPRVMVETDDIQAAVRAVTDYVALRVVEREKALASDSIGGRALQPARPVPVMAAAEPPPLRRAAEPAAPPPSVDLPKHAPRDGHTALAAFLWFSLGVAVGILAVLAFGLMRARGMLAG